MFAHKFYFILFIFILITGRIEYTCISKEKKQKYAYLKEDA
jgi:hypothetical protein